MWHLDFESGTCGTPTSVRRVRDLARLFPDADPDDDRVVYRTYGMSGDDTEQPALRWATTVIEPGDVKGEPFMTRGHSHVNPDRGEWMMTLRGTGELLLKQPGQAVATQAMRPGSVHLIDGSLAHRVLNTGQEPLAFVVVWLSDCGHDYAVDF